MEAIHFQLRYVRVCLRHLRAFGLEQVLHIERGRLPEVIGIGLVGDTEYVNPRTTQWLRTIIDSPLNSFDHNPGKRQAYIAQANNAHVGGLRLDLPLKIIEMTHLV